MTTRKKVFIICPVRHLNEETKKHLSNYVAKLEKKGIDVHWPPRDTNQNDTTGLNICYENREAISRAHEIHIWFRSGSQGSIFDLGMFFAFSYISNKKIVIINKNEITPTPHKSFQNVLLELEKASH